MYTSLTGDEDEAVDNYHVSMLMLAPRRQQVNDTRRLCGFKCPANRKLLLKIISRRCALITVLSLRCVHCAPHSLPAGCWCCTQICSLFTQHSGVCGGWGGARLISALLQVCLYVYDIRWDVAWILAFDNLFTCEVLSLVVTHTWLCLQQSSGHTSPQVTSTDSWMEQSACCSTTHTNTRTHTHTCRETTHNTNARRQTHCTVGNL